MSYELESNSGVTVTPIGGGPSFTPKPVDASGVHGLAMVAAGTAACDGQVTIRFTWVPTSGESAPAVCVVREVSGASWSGESGSCEDGLGHPEVNQGSTGTLYMLRQNPGGAFTWICFPKATGSRTQAAQGVTATARIDYESAALPIEVAVG